MNLFLLLYLVSDLTFPCLPCIDEATPTNSNRKTKTFSEILNEKAKSGYRIGYNLHKYVGSEEDDADHELVMIGRDNRRDNRENNNQGNVN